MQLRARRGGERQPPPPVPPGADRAATRAAALTRPSASGGSTLPASPALHIPPPPSQPETEEPDMLICTPNTANLKRLRCRRTMEFILANPVLSPTENTLPHRPSKKNRKMVSDKEYYDSESTPYQIDRYENDQGQNYCSPAPSRKRAITIGAYTVQCGKCLKWRLVPTKKKYEEIRERIRQVPFLCEQSNEWKPGVTCCDPTDVSQDGRRIWAIDKPSIVRPPLGWERIITVRNEGCTKFADVYYIPPTGKTLRSTADVQKYLEQNPQYAAGVQLSQFSFKEPTPLRRDYVKKRPPQSKPLEQEVVPLSCEPPPSHEDLENKILVPYEEANPARDMPQDQRLDDVQTSN